MLTKQAVALQITGSLVLKITIWNETEQKFYQVSVRLWLSHLKSKAKEWGKIRVTFISEKRLRVVKTIWQIFWVEKKPKKLTNVFNTMLKCFILKMSKWTGLILQNVLGLCIVMEAEENKRLSSPNYLRTVSSYHINARRCLGSSTSQSSCLPRVPSPFHKMMCSLILILTIFHFAWPICMSLSREGILLTSQWFKHMPEEPEFLPMHWIQQRLN